jgi:hypothetical protein
MHNHFLIEMYQSLTSGFQKQKEKKDGGRWVPVAHTYNPSNSGGRNQEDHGSKPVPEK